MKNILLGSTALIAFSLIAGGANAACTPTTTPGSNTTVNCDATSTVPVVAAAGSKNVTVNINDGANLHTSVGAGAVTVNSNSVVNLLGSGQINTDTAVGAIGIYAADAGNRITMHGNSRIDTKFIDGFGIKSRGNNTTVELDDNSYIHTEINVGGIGAIAQGILFAYKTAGSSLTGENLTLNGTAHIRTEGRYSSGVTFYHAGKSNVTLNDSGSVRTQGDDAKGIEFRGVNAADSQNTATLNGNSSVLTNGKRADGIYIAGSGSQVTLNGTAHVFTYGDNSNGVVVKKASTVNLNSTGKIITKGSYSHGVLLADDNSSLHLTGNSYIKTEGKLSSGVKIAGNGATIDLKDGSHIDTTGDQGYGIEGALSAAITLNGNSFISTTGDTARGIFGLYKSSVILNDDSHIKTTGDGAAGIFSAGAFNNITLNDTAHIFTYGDGAVGVELGIADKLTLKDSSRIVTAGKGSAGIHATDSNASINLSGTSSVITKGDYGNGIFAQNSPSNLSVYVGTGGVATYGKHADAISLSYGQNTALTLNGSTVLTTKDASRGVVVGGQGAGINIKNGVHLTTQGNQATAIDLHGNSQHVNITGHNLIKTSGQSSYGASLSGDGDVFSFYGASSSYIHTDGKNADGLHITGNGTTVHIGGAGTSIETRGDTAHAINIASANNVITLNGSDPGTFLFTSNGDGIHILAGGNNLISLTGHSGIVVGNFNNRAIYAATDHNSILINTTYGLIETHATGSKGIELKGNYNLVDIAGTLNMDILANKSAGIAATGSHNRVNLSGNAHIVLLDEKDTGVQLGDSGILTMSGNAQIFAGTGSLGDDNGNGIYLRGDASAAALSGNSYISTNGLQTNGIFSLGNHALLGLDQQARVVTNGKGAAGVLIAGDDSGLIMQGNSKIATHGEAAYGTYIDSNRAVAVLQGTSSITTTGKSAFGLLLTNANNTVTLNGSAQISTSGEAAHGFALHGTKATVSLHDKAKITATGTNANGIDLDADGLQSAIMLDGTSQVAATGAGGVGVALNGADNVHVLVLGNSKVTSAHANGIIVVSGTHDVVAVDTNALIHSDGDSAIHFTGSLNTLVNFGTISSSTGLGFEGDDANADFVENSGTISGGAGLAVNLGAGDDSLILHTGSKFVGNVEGGAGTDTLTLDGIGADNTQFLHFEKVITQNNADFALSGTSQFDDIDIQSGRLRVNGNLTATSTEIEAGGVLGGTGTLTGSVTGNGHINPGDNGIGTLTINGGLSLSGGQIDIDSGRGGFDKLIVHGSAGFSGTALNIHPGGTTGGTAKILQVDNGINGSLGTVNFVGNGGAGVVQTANDITVTAASGTPAVAGDFAGTQAGMSFLDTVGGQMVTGSSSCGADSCARPDDAAHHLWAQGFGEFGSEKARNGDDPFDYTVAGSAVGADMRIAKDFRLGLSAGYSNTDENVAKNLASTNIDTVQLALYAQWQHGPFFLTGLLSGGWQSLDLSRQVSNNGVDTEADADTRAWLLGGSVQAGANFYFPHGWRLTPSAGIGFQRQIVKGFDEHGGGGADISVKGHHSDAMSLRAQLELANDIPVGDLVLTPHFSLGAQQQIHLGGHAEGVLQTGDTFNISLKNETKTTGLAGAGIDVTFANGLSTFVDYNGMAGSGTVVHSVTGGIRYSW